MLFPEIELKIPGSMAQNHAQHQSFLADVRSHIHCLSSTRFLTYHFLSAQLSDLLNYMVATKPEHGSAPFDAAVFKQKVRPVPSKPTLRAADALGAQVDAILLPVMTHLADELDSLDGAKVPSFPCFALPAWAQD